MKVNEVSISYGITHSLKGYNNVKSSISLVAQMEQGDDEEQVAAQMTAQAQQYVHEQIDNALESVGQAAFYSDAPRFDLYRLDHTDYIVLLPSELRNAAKNLPYSLFCIHDDDREYMNNRFAAARRAAMHYTTIYTRRVLIDMTDAQEINSYMKEILSLWDCWGVMIVMRENDKQQFAQVISFPGEFAHDLYDALIGNVRLYKDEEHANAMLKEHYKHKWIRINDKIALSAFMDSLDVADPPFEKVAN